MLVISSLLVGQSAWAAQAIQHPNEYPANHENPQSGASPIVPFNEANTVETEDATFHLEKIIVNDHSQFAHLQEQLRPILQKYEQQDVGMQELNQLIGEITLYVREHGYPAATAYLPQQTSSDGIIQVNIEEGKYGQIIIENESRLHTEVIERLVSGLHTGEIIRGKTLETALYNISDLGGVRAGGIMRPGANLGETDIVIRVEDGKRDSYVLYSENYGSKSSGRYRLGLGINRYEMSGIGDHLAISGSISNENQHNYGLQYDQLIGKNGTKLGITISRTDYELGSHYSALGAVGESTGIGLYGSTPLWKTSSSRLGIRYGWDYRRLKDEMREFDYLIKKHSNAFYLGIDGMESIIKTKLSYDLTLYAGRLGYDDARIGNIPLQVNNDGKYTKALLNANIVHNFNPTWDLSIKLQAQQAGNNLDASEQIYLGGANAVRAYPQGEGSGDEGYQASAELRYHTKIPGLIASTFFDIGHVKYSHNGATPGGTTLKGWGLGLTYSESNGYWAKLDYARRIGLADHATDEAHDKGRIWFILGKSW